ncbi:MAG: 2-oxo acid dehydrogenase subunit E2, partial [Acidimicrobiia bacterium]|nr:2-oxo acid dehydrogenase subunit E2 [Acidimicrobiia bacterium]
HMIHAKRTAAHVWTSIEVDYEQVEHVRGAHRDRFKADEGFSLTYLPFIARATMDALSAFPVVNSSLDLDAGTATFHHRVNLGIAVDLDTKGLLVATVRDADGLTLKGLARGIRQMAEKARDGALEPDDIAGSTFTITNPGPFGSYLSAPIINLPNVAILSTETVKKRPTVVTLPDGTDTIAVRHIGYLGLTWDHRAFDGSIATKFLNRIQTNLETWDWGQELR